MEDNKKEILLKRISGRLEHILRQLEEEGHLDYFDIEINNHNGSVKINKIEKYKMRVY